MRLSEEAYFGLYDELFGMALDFRAGKGASLSCIRVVAGLLLWSLLLSGCATHPLVDDVTRKTTYDVVEQIRCEAKRAILDHARGFTNAAVAYEFTFDITESNDASAVAAWTYPFTNGLFSLTANAGSNRVRNTRRNFKLVDSFADLRRADCSHDTLQKNWVYPISGEIGIYEVVATFAKLQRADHPTDKEVFSFSDKLKFVTVLGGGLKPKVTLGPLNERFRLTEAAADLGAGRTDTHEVVIALTAGEQPIAIDQPVPRAGRVECGLCRQGGLALVRSALPRLL